MSTKFDIISTDIRGTWCGRRIISDSRSRLLSRIYHTLLTKNFFSANIYNMSRYKCQYNRIALTSSGNTFWGATTNVILGVAPPYYTQLNEARLILSFTATSGTGALALVITRPPITWISTCNATIVYRDGSGHQHTENYSTQSNRGDIGYVLELLDLSYAGWVNSQAVEVLKVPSAVPVTADAGVPAIFEVAIPLRYLVDPCISRKFLPIDTITLQPSVRSIDECLFFGATATGTKTCTLNTMYVEYPTVLFNSAPERALTVPDMRLIYAVPFNIATGGTQTSITFTPPGRPVYLYHFFLNAGVNGTTQAGYSLVMPGGADNWVKFQQVNVGGKVFPLNPNYNTVNSRIGTIPFYHELQCITNKYAAGKDMFISYENFLTDYRIYAIDLSDYDGPAATLQVNIQYGAATAPCIHVIFAMVIPS